VQNLRHNEIEQLATNERQRTLPFFVANFNRVMIAQVLYKPKPGQRTKILD